MKEKIEVAKFQKLCDPVIGNCWDLDQPITQSEIKDAVRVGSLLSPTLSTKFTLREEHIARIAWFVTYGWADPIHIDVGVPSLGCNPKWLLGDGNHRFAAAIIRGDTTIDAYVSGEVDIIQTFLFRKGETMRKVHYKVVLDVFVHENEGADVNDALSGSDFDPVVDGDGDEFDVMDVSIESVEVTDSR